MALSQPSLAPLLLASSTTHPSPNSTGTESSNARRPARKTGADASHLSSACQVAVCFRTLRTKQRAGSSLARAFFESRFVMLRRGAPCSVYTV
uniref:Putative secreted protein n=1 Tax=Ixodes ricinus TaxID=34613 RepID=A0A6B0U249_IXORI